jgi:hypothetical protein
MCRGQLRRTVQDRGWPSASFGVVVGCQGVTDHGHDPDCISIQRLIEDAEAEMQLGRIERAAFYRWLGSAVCTPVPIDTGPSVTRLRVTKTAWPAFGMEIFALSLLTAASRSHLRR